MAERGWGSPSAVVGSVEFDWGWGHPTPSPYTDGEPVTEGGWGEPFFILQPLVVDFLGGGTLVPPVFADEGGQFIRLVATWDDAGPYRARLVDADGNYHPSSEWCYSGVTGQGSNLYPSASGEYMDLVLPPAPPGVYGIRFEYGIGWYDSLTITNALRIVRRSRRAADSRFCERIPARFDAGPARLVDATIYRGGA